MNKGPILTRSGTVIQSGLRARDRKDPFPNQPRRAPYRAIVANTYVFDDDNNLTGASVECDVILLVKNIRYQHVPVVQTQHGVNNAHGLWVPRKTTRVINEDGTAVNLDRVTTRRGTFVAEATPFHKVDGDMVLIDFMEGDPTFPIITGCLPHLRTNRPIKAGEGWREGDTSMRGEMRPDEYYLSHYGTEVRINEQGDIVIDSVGAFDDPATEDAGAASGQVRIRVKDGQRFTVAMGDDEDVLEVWKDGGQLKIDLGEAADQRLVLGDDFDAAMGTFLSALDTFAEKIAVAPLSSGGTVALATPDLTAIKDAITDLDSDIGNALSDLARTKKS